MDFRTSTSSYRASIERVATSYCYIKILERELMGSVCVCVCVCVCFFTACVCVCVCVVF